VNDGTRRIRKSKQAITGSSISNRLSIIRQNDAKNGEYGSFSVIFTRVKQSLSICDISI